MADMLLSPRPDSERAATRPWWRAAPRWLHGGGGAVSALMLGDRCQGVRVEAGDGRPRVVEAVEGDAAELRRWKPWLRGSRVVLVLDAEQRQLQLRDRPGVPDEEMAQALRWPMAETLGVDAEALLVSAVGLPPLNEASRPQVLGVAALMDTVKPLLAMAGRTGVEIRHIDVIDTAMRGMVLLHRPRLRSAVTVCLAGSAVCIGLIRDGGIAGLRSVPLPAREGASDLALADQLALNARRTFDYYERQAGLMARDAGTLAIDHALASVESLSPEAYEIFASALPQAPERFRVDEVLDGAPEVLQRCHGHDQLTALACVGVARLHDHGVLAMPAAEGAA